MANDGRLASSFRDPSGFVFRRDGAVYRQINQCYAANFEQFTRSGLYDRLVGKGLLLPHEDSDEPAADPSLAFKVIRPQQIRFISYPYEWPFSALKLAALATLQIQEEALGCGMTLKDASAYNIQFVNAKPVFIDTLSFEPYTEGRPWVAYQQFCKHFLAPLALMSMRDVRCGRWLGDYVDGIPLDLAGKLLPRRSLLNFGLLLHIHLHARSQAKFADHSAEVSQTSARDAQPIKPVSLQGSLGILDSLRSTILKLDWASKKSEWGRYYDATNYSDQSMQQKQDLVTSFLDKVRPENVWDLGANTGRFSRLASQRGIPTVAFDIDPVAVDTNFRACQEHVEKNLMPLLLDLTNPSAAIGWENSERDSFMQRGPADMIFALALVHHLAISNNVPLPMLAQFFSRLCRSLIIEFVPKSDSQVRRLLATREDVFPDYDPEHFRASFAAHFDILEERRVGDSDRMLYLMTRRG